MTENWKPGDVAIWRYLTAEQVALRVHGCQNENHVPGPHWHLSDGGWTANSSGNTRRLVVIDPEDREQVDRLAGLVAGQVIGSIPTNLDLQAALREFASPTPPKRMWTDGDVVLVWNNHDRTGIAIVLSRHRGEWMTPTGSGWDVESVEDALASRGTQHFRCGEVLREQAAEVSS